MEKVMRILPLFIVLLLFSGTIILCYMGWVAFSGRIDHFTLQQAREPLITTPIKHNKGGATPLRNSPLIGDGDQSFDNLNEKRESNPNDPENEGLPPGLISVNVDVLRDPDQERKIELLKMKVISKLRRHILNGAKIKGHINEYGVNFAKLKPKSQKIDRKAVICKIKKIAKIKLINEDASPLFGSKSFPTQSLFNVEGKGSSSRDSNNFFNKEITPEPLYKTCAVIPNSAAFDGARHGIDIDSHDFILRFNNAPTLGYEDDIGSLTSLRIVNSQVVTKPQFNFPSTKFSQNYEKQRKKSSTPIHTGSNNSSMRPPHVYQDPAVQAEKNTKMELDAMNLNAVWDSTRKYLIWDPCNYSSTVEQWYQNPDFPFFEKYFNLTSQTNRQEKNRFYLLDCRVIWRMWEILQEYSFVKIYGNPPTSGFIGIMLSLQICERVNVYEYIPSIRESNRCHYYGPKNESNPSCTYGAWHPVSAEKLFFLSISDGTDKSVFLDGVLSIPGVSNFNC